MAETFTTYQTLNFHFTLKNLQSNVTFRNCVGRGAAAVSFVRIATALLNWSSLNLAPGLVTAHVRHLIKFDLHLAPAST